MAKDKSISKRSSKSKAPAPELPPGDRPSPIDTVNTKGPPTTSKRRGFLGFLRSDKSKSSKKIVEQQQQQEHDKSGPAADATSNNNNVKRASSFSEPGSSKQEQQPRKVKRHLSVSRSGKMKEVRKRTSLAELSKRFENQAQV